MAFDFTDPRSVARRAPVYALAFEEAGNALAIQRQLLADVRSRATGVVTTAALVTTFLGGLSPAGARNGAATYLATVAFLVVGASAFALFWLGDLEMTEDPKALIREYAEPSSAPLALVHRDFAIHRAASIAHNRRMIERMEKRLRLAVASLAAEVLAWVVSYVLTL